MNGLWFIGCKGISTVLYNLIFLWEYIEECSLMTSHIPGKTSAWTRMAFVNRLLNPFDFAFNNDSYLQVYTAQTCLLLCWSTGRSSPRPWRLLGRSSGSCSSIRCKSTADVPEVPPGVPLVLTPLENEVFLFTVYCLLVYLRFPIFLSWPILFSFFCIFFTLVLI